MSSRLFVMIALLIVSEAVGLALGEWFYRLFLKAVPPVALSQFNAGSAHIVYLSYGGGVGLVLFIWAHLGIAISRLQQLGGRSEAKS
jgi:hypothetical protein